MREIIGTPSVCATAISKLPDRHVIVYSIQVREIIPLPQRAEELADICNEYRLKRS